MFNRVLTTTARPGERVYDLSTVRHLAGVPQRFSSLLLPHSRWPVGRFGPRARAWSAKFCHRVPFSSSRSLSLCGVDIPVSTRRTELPGLSVAANSFIKRASIPTSVSAPQAALAAAFRRIRPVSDPKKLKLKQTSAERRVSDAGRVSHLAGDRCDGLLGEWRPARACPADGCA